MVSCALRTRHEQIDGLCTPVQQTDFWDRDDVLRIRNSLVGIGKTDLLAQVAVSPGTMVIQIAED